MGEGFVKNVKAITRRLSAAALDASETVGKRSDPALFSEVETFCPSVCRQLRVYTNGLRQSRRCLTNWYTSRHRER